MGVGNTEDGDIGDGGSGVGDTGDSGMRESSMEDSNAHASEFEIAKVVTRKVDGMGLGGNKRHGGYRGSRWGMWGDFQALDGGIGEMYHFLHSTLHYHYNNGPA